MEKQDLTQYSDSELSMIVFNDETLYRMRRSRYLVDTLNEFFIFTDEQLDELKQDLLDEEEEENKEEEEEEDEE